MHHLKLSIARPPIESEICIGAGVRRDVGALLGALGDVPPGQIAVVSNKKVYSLYGNEVVRSLKGTGLRVSLWLMPEGERHKSFRVLERAVQFLADKSFERNDLVVALGGGVVGDLAGFAAAVYLRGVRFIQLPTTLLAQIDASVGGKTAINLRVGKNLVGAFHQPSIVVIDVETLNSLPSRELVSGFCEMLKQSLVADQSLFEQTKDFLAATRDNGFAATLPLQELIAAHCKFKASIVSGDERETTSRADAKSRKVLNFGHTTAHALEAVTDYRTFRHGEAVGYGMLVATEISKNMGLLDAYELQSIREAIALCGPLPPADNVAPRMIERALQHDKKRIAGKINWVLLDGIGLPKIVSGADIPPKILRSSLEKGLRTATRKSTH